MAKKKKRAWDNSNPLYRYLHGGKKKKKQKKKRRVRSMARKRTSRKSGGFGGNKLMNGIIKPSGIIGQMIMGAGAATLVENVGITPLGANTGIAAGFLVGGIGGAAGAFARNAIKGRISLGNSSSMSGSGY